MILFNPFKGPWNPFWKLSICSIGIVDIIHFVLYNTISKGKKALGLSGGGFDREGRGHNTQNQFPSAKRNNAMNEEKKERKKGEENQMKIQSL